MDVRDMLRQMNVKDDYNDVRQLRRTEGTCMV